MINDNYRKECQNVPSQDYFNSEHHSSQCNDSKAGIRSNLCQPYSQTYCLIYCFLILQTSNAMLWLLYNIARHPKVQEKLYEEVTSIIGKAGNMKEEDFARIPYMKACLKESLR